MTAIHWFRRDLRLADNPALLAAAAGGEVVGVFVLDDTLWGSAGAPRRAYLLRSLAALDASMAGRLLVLRGDPVEAIPRLAREVEAAAVHVAASYEPYGVRRDRAVESALEGVGASLVRTGSAYAVDPGVLRTRTGGPFQVFTPFRSAWLEHGWPGPAGDGARVRWADPVRWAGPRGSTTLPAEPDLGGVRLPAAGEGAARRRWAAALEDVVPRYAGERDRPDVEGTSRMSAALRWGEAHPRTLLADLGRLPGDGAAIFRSELAWREFHADVLHHHPSARTESLRPVAPEDAWADGDREHAWLTAWQKGRTGYPFVDAGMRQLRAEGWMHGRLRMVVASFLVKDLHIRWQRGAEHFMRWLVDADVAQNQLNWQWVAGTGRDAAPFFRVFNPVAQGQRFDPHGDYVRRWVPELRGVAGAAVHEPWRLPAGTVDYPDRLVDHAAERRVALADNARARASR